MEKSQALVRARISANSQRCSELRSWLLPMAMCFRGVLLGACVAWLCQAASLSPLYQYAFQARTFQEATFTSTAEAVVLSGRSPRECSDQLDFTDANVSFVALALTDKGQGCFGQAAYSNGDFPIVLGTVQLGDDTFDAFEIQPPQSSAEQFVASGQQLYIRLSNTSSDYRLYLLENGVLIPMAQLKSDVTNTFVPTGMAVEGLSTAAVYLVLPANRSLPAPAKRILSGHGVTECAETFPEAETFGDISLVTMKQASSGSCWKDLRYSNTDYTVEIGELAGSDGNSFTAYRISPPAVTATQFTASGTQLYIRQATAGPTNIWTFMEASGFSLVDTMNAAQTYNKTSVRVDQLSEPMLVILQPSSARVSIWPLEATEVEAAWLGGKADGSFSLSARRFAVPGQPFRPDTDWSYGPGTHTGNYGTYKRFFVVTHADGREGVVWQDFSGDAVKLTWLAADYLSSQTIQLSPLSSTIFVGAVGDAQGNVVLLLGAAGSPEDKTATSSAEVVKYDAAGTELLRVALPTTDLDIYAFSSSGASFAWDLGSGTIAVSLARTMTRASDGLNHQGGIAFVLNATTLQMITNYGQTSGHSFANSLTVSQKDGWYIGKDLGDNYPRGINLWELKATSRSWKKRLVYAFKTKHGTSETSPAGAAYPRYDEISTSDQTYYKWSNDNYVYTELAHPGLHEINDTVLVFFAGESPPLDNAVVGQALNVARNVGFVKIPRDLSSDAVLSPGANETGGFYTFGGGWSDQMNRGVSFLTSKTEVTDSVSRLKTAQRGGAVLLFWEVWSRTAYNKSECMIVDTNGAVLQSQTSLAYPVMLPFADDVVVINGKAVVYAGSPEQQLVRYEFCHQGCDSPRATAATSTTNASPGGGEPGGDGEPGGGEQGGDGGDASDASAAASRVRLCAAFLTAVTLALS